jgi:long-chain acyl-CoA synthetase
MYVVDDMLTFGEVDRTSDAIAHGLRSGGVGVGERVAIYVQNDPQFVLAQLGVWKLGAVMVSINPMLKADELEYVLRDSGAVALVVLDELYEHVARHVLDATDVDVVVTTAAGDGVAVVRAATGDAVAVDADGPTVDLVELVAAWDGTVPDPVRQSVDDVACIGYTSGTSGRPKGVTTTHANLLHNAEVYQRWLDIGPGDVFVCGAPLFHITGLVAGTATSHLSGMALVLFHRFDAGEFLRLTEQWKGTVTVMAITAFRALLQHPDLADRSLSSLTKVYSGGAPVSQAASDAWEAATGSPVHNIYGLTETCSPSHAVPLGRRAPVDPETDALAVGVPVPGCHSRIVDPETLEDVPSGAPGEIWIKGPMVTPGYWERPDADHESFHEGYLRTGDIGKTDEAGWFYVIDRLKDIINASGYKVSPREVEERLCSHPRVLEAAVVGVADPYRGETVKAFVSLTSGDDVEPDDLIEFCRQSMAAYKYPRAIEIVDELPKTASGKILRRELRRQT